jgi:hypothetical protein
MTDPCRLDYTEWNIFSLVTYFVFVKNVVFHENYGLDHVHTVLVIQLLTENRQLRHILFYSVASVCLLAKCKNIKFKISAGIIA